MQSTFLKQRETHLAEGIKTVGVGKKGSKPMPLELIEAITQELKDGAPTEIATGAFFGSLIMKGLTQEEMQLSQALPADALKNPQILINHLALKAPEVIKGICLRLLNKEELDQKTAYILGKFLFSDEPGDACRGIVASVLRVRYETADEYAGLLQAMEDCVGPEFRQPIPPGDPIIQMAEPFDGVDHSNMITPLVADYLQTLGFRVANLVGRNSGPKFVFNLSDIAQSLNATFLKQNSDFISQPDFGYFIHQADLSIAIDHWVDLRHQTIKRPFLATLERFLNPIKADIIIASAFHPPYGEKMITICERAGFAAAIIVRNGMEGTLAFPLMRSAKILISVKQKDGMYRRHEMDFNVESELGIKVNLEERLELPSLEENVRLIKEYKQTAKTDHVLFDARIRATCTGLNKAIQWIKENQ